MESDRKSAERSYLFVPADRPERFRKALGAGADAVVVDLEDAVPAEGKSAARDQVANWLGDGTRVIVRINGDGTRWHADDLRLCIHPAVVQVMVPKAEAPDALTACSQAAGGKRVLALLETAKGIAGARAIATTACVQRLVFGSLDLQLDLGIDGDDHELLAWRSELVLASRLGELIAPVDGVTPGIGDDSQLARDAERARKLGFGGKLCIHPHQLAAVHAAFTSPDSEIQWARRVIEASQRSGGGAVALDGKMVDLPVVRKAQAVMQRAQRITAS